MATYVPPILPENYRVLQASVYAHTGIVLGTDKEYLLHQRLSGIVCDLGLGSINDLCRLLQQERSQQIGQRVAEAMTTNETYFFREPAHYELIRKTLLPSLASERKGTRKLRFWSAACSTGQEAYSLAMLLQQEGYGDWDAKILGSDYSAKVAARAREGVYQQLEVNRGIPAPALVRFFQRSGLDWTISETVRGMCTFETRDLRQSMRTLGPFDMVFCRNVMIYFDSETKATVLRNLHGTLHRGGWLLLGGAEASLDSPEYFDKQRIDGVTVYVAR
jgi:chemotaxis protein methyltransferase CheR